MDAHFRPESFIEISIVQLGRSSSCNVVVTRTGCEFSSGHSRPAAVYTVLNLSTDPASVDLRLNATHTLPSPQRAEGTWGSSYSNNLTLFEVTHFRSREATAARSLGRKPRETRKQRLAAKRRQQSTPRQFAVAAARLPNSFRSNSLGLRPRLSAVGTPWLKSATSKLTFRVSLAGAKYRLNRHRLRAGWCGRMRW